MSLSLQIIFFALCVLLGFVFPPAFIGAVVLGFGIWSDMNKDPDAPAESLQKGGAGSRLYSEKDHFRQVSESPAEEAFFDAMVSAFNLDIRDRKRGRLTGDEGLTLDMQVEVMSYRLDFLIDKRLVVEIDGAAWHSSPEAQARDNMRDESLRNVGYHILRIPAKHALYSPNVAIQAVRDARVKIQLEDAQNLENRIHAAKHGGAPVGTPAAQLKEALRPKRLLSAVNEFSDGLSEFSANLEETLIKAKAQAEIDQAQAKRKWLEEEAQAIQDEADLKQLDRRWYFLSLIVKAEVERVMAKKNASQYDYEHIYGLYSRRVNEIKHALTVLDRKSEEEVRMPSFPSYWSKSSVDEEYPKVDHLKPKDRDAWLRWMELVKSEPSHDWLNEFEPTGTPNVALPPIGADVEAWRRKVQQIVEQHYPLPASLR